MFKFLNRAGYVDDDGFAIPEMSGVIKWFYRDDASDDELWFDSKQECLEDVKNKKLEDVTATSFTFILSSAKDNPYQTDDYISKLSNLSRIDRARLKDGNWKIESEEGELFKRIWWGRAIRPPKQDQFKKIVRAWDLAATEKTKTNDPAYTASVLMGITKDNHFWVLDAVRFRESPAKSRARFLAIAEQDREQWGRITTTFPQDPGQAGKDQKQRLAAHMAGHTVKFMATIGSKLDRAEDVSIAVENGLVTLLVSEWNDMLINEGATFPHGKFKDLIDSLADAYDFLTDKKRTKKNNWMS